MAAMALVAVTRIAVTTPATTPVAMSRIATMTPVAVTRIAVTRIAAMALVAVTTPAVTRGATVTVPGIGGAARQDYQQDQTDQEEPSVHGVVSFPNSVMVLALRVDLRNNLTFLSRLVSDVPESHRVTLTPGLCTTRANDHAAKPGGPDLRFGGSAMASGIQNVPLASEEH